MARWINRAATLANKKQDIEGAIAALESAVEIAPDHPVAASHLYEAIMHLGNRQFEAGEYEDSIATYERAVTLEPTNPRARQNVVGAVLAIVSRLEDEDALQEAVDLIAKHVERYPESRRLKRRLESLEEDL